MLKKPNSCITWNLPILSIPELDVFYLKLYISSTLGVTISAQSNLNLLEFENR